MIVIHCGKPNFITAENSVFHRSQVVRTEQQLCAFLIQLRVLEHLNHIPEQLRMQLGIQFVHNHWAAFLQCYHQNRQSCYHLLGSIRLRFKWKFIDLAVDRSLREQVLAIFIMFAMGFVIIVVPIGALTTWSSRKLAVKR